ncbi:MAG: glycosyltransferase family 4 protein [Betaproteobacteria bacterium]|nr:glycosyltransferase family 4 protein [Betaproteobacteria bacterium]
MAVNDAILVDVTRLAARLLEGKHPTGVDRVSLAYIAHFRAQARAVVRHWGRWMQLSPPASQRMFAAFLGEDDQPKTTIRRAVAAAYVLPSRLTDGALLFNTGHSGLDDPQYALRVQRHGVRPVYFLHDLIPLTHPEYCRAGEVDKHHQRLRTIVHTGHGVIANSQATLHDFLAYARAHNLSAPADVVAHLGVSPLPEPAPTPPVASPYFVMLGTIEARKNHLMVLHAWREVVERLGVAAPKLVIIGQRGWECEQVVDLLERCEALHDVVQEVPRCDDAQLATWLAHAQALLFPSFAEGYGLPLVEALAAGVPVIASDLPAFREVAGDVPHYLDPIDGVGWLQAVLAFADPRHPGRQAQLVRMQGFEAPSWKAHFVKVDAWLRQIGHGRQRVSAPEMHEAGLAPND